MRRILIQKESPRANLFPHGLGQAVRENEYSRQAIEQGIEIGRGEVWRELSPNQYAKIIGIRAAETPLESADEMSAEGLPVSSGPADQTLRLPRGTGRDCAVEYGSREETIAAEEGLAMVH